MPSSPESTCPDSARQGRSPVPATVALLLVGAVATIAFWHKHRDDSLGLLDGARAAQSPMDSQESPSGPLRSFPRQQSTASSAAADFPSGNADDLSAAALGGRPLTAEPANLPHFPGPGAQRQFGLRRRNGPDVEDMSYWRIAPAPGAASSAAAPVSLQEVADFYRHAAAQAGFVPLIRPPAAAPFGSAAKMTLAFVPEHPGFSGAGGNSVPGGAAVDSSAVLTLSLERDGSGVRVLLVFRYPIQRLR